MTNLDKLIATLSQEELADLLREACIDKDNFKRYEGGCDNCGHFTTVGDVNCTKRQTEWLLEEYKSQIDWSRCGEPVVMKGGTFDHSLCLINGICDGSIYIVIGVDDLHKTTTLNDMTVPEYARVYSLGLEGRTFETYIRKEV